MAQGDRRPRRRVFQSGEMLDRFRLERLLGEGAFGQVFLALDEGDYGFRKRVALKVLTEFNNSRRLDALMREARICAAMNHPNVVDVYGVMKTDDAAFIIMEFVEGETLQDLWRDMEAAELRFPRSIVLDLGIAVAEALHHAWTAKDTGGERLNIVHRDLKPANIMISDRGVAKVADFGIAKVADDTTQTRTGKLKGTPSYLPPELWAGSRDFRPTMDLFSLGVILYELTAGKRFYGRVTVGQIFGILKDRSPASEAADLANYFPELQPIVERLLQRDPNARFQGGLEVAEALRGVKSQVGSPGDLLQFSRLVRASRLAPDERAGSLAAMPTIMNTTPDWGALMALALGARPLEEALPEQPGAPARITPLSESERRPTPHSPPPVGLGPRPSRQEEEPTRELDMEPPRSRAPVGSTAPSPPQPSAPARSQTTRAERNENDDFWTDSQMAHLGEEQAPDLHVGVRPRSRYAMKAPGTSDDLSTQHDIEPLGAASWRDIHPMVWALGGAATLLALAAAFLLIGSS